MTRAMIAFLWAGLAGLTAGQGPKTVTFASAIPPLAAGTVVVHEESSSMDMTVFAQQDGSRLLVMPPLESRFSSKDTMTILEWDGPLPSKVRYSVVSVKFNGEPTARVAAMKRLVGRTFIVEDRGGETTVTDAEGRPVPETLVEAVQNTLNLKRTFTLEGFQFAGKTLTVGDSVEGDFGALGRAMGEESKLPAPAKGSKETMTATLTKVASIGGLECAVFDVSLRMTGEPSPGGPPVPMAVDIKGTMTMAVSMVPVYAGHFEARFTSPRVKGSTGVAMMIEGGLKLNISSSMAPTAK